MQNVTAYLVNVKVSYLQQWLRRTVKRGEEVVGGVQHPDSLVLLEALGPCPWQDTGVREVSPGMLMAVLLRQVWKLPAREGGGAPLSVAGTWGGKRDFAKAGTGKFGGVGFSPAASACLKEQHVDETL